MDRCLLMTMITYQVPKSQNSLSWWTFLVVGRPGSAAARATARAKIANCIRVVAGFKCKTVILRID